MKCERELGSNIFRKMVHGQQSVVEAMDAYITVKTVRDRSSLSYWIFVSINNFFLGLLFLVSRFRNFTCF